MGRAPRDQVENVSSTALWVATYRAMESKRPDALFRDPYAEVLAGERGPRIVAELPGGAAGSANLAVRTQVIDEWILHAVREQGVDLVLNLGAGLDTRPYRLPLPPHLLWIEVDYPELTDYKSGILGPLGAKPVCRLETLRADLGDEAQRQAAIAHAGRLGRKILVITEGVVVYLTEAQANDLSRDLLAEPTVRFWLQEYYDRRVVRYLMRVWGRSFKNAPLQFLPESWLGFFESRGWSAREIRNSFDEGERLNRRMPHTTHLVRVLMFFSKKMRNHFRRITGFYWLERL